MLLDTLLQRPRLWRGLILFAWAGLLGAPPVLAWVIVSPKLPWQYVIITLAALSWASSFFLTWEDVKSRSLVVETLRFSQYRTWVGLQAIGGLSAAVLVALNAFSRLPFSLNQFEAWLILTLWLYVLAWGIKSAAAYVYLHWLTRD
jgi:hypothetical protein